MRRHPVLIGAIAVVALVAGLVVAGGLTVASNAVSVDGIALSQASLDRDLTTIQQNQAFACYLEASVIVRTQSSRSLPPLGTLSANRTYNTAFVDFWLSEQVNDLLIEHLADQEHLALSASIVSAGRVDLIDSIDTTLADAAVLTGQSAVCAPDGASILGTLPAGMVDELVRAQAAGDVVLAHAAGYRLDTADLARYFQGHEDQFETICLSAIQAASQSAALLARADIESGQSFSSVAQQVSTDQSSAPSGGQLGCFSAAQGAYPTVAADVAGLAVGQLSQPVADNGSYLLLEVTSTQPADFEAIIPAVRQAVLKLGSAKAVGALSLLTKHAQVSVDPRYGRWSDKSGIGIEAPLSPATKDLLNAKA